MTQQAKIIVLYILIFIIFRQQTARGKCFRPNVTRKSRI